jgi:hypothetical protein
MLHGLGIPRRTFSLQIWNITTKGQKMCQNEHNELPKYAKRMQHNAIGD